MISDSRRRFWYAPAVDEQERGLIHEQAKRQKPICAGRRPQVPRPEQHQTQGNDDQTLRPRPPSARAANDCPGAWSIQRHAIVIDRRQSTASANLCSAVLSATTLARNRCGLAHRAVHKHRYFPSLKTQQQVRANAHTRARSVLRSVSPRIPMVRPSEGWAIGVLRNVRSLIYERLIAS
jgi:hypothetical protein